MASQAPQPIVRGLLRPHLPVDKLCVIDANERYLDVVIDATPFAVNFPAWDQHCRHLDHHRPEFLAKGSGDAARGLHCFGVRHAGR
jgi:hypothetical protein